MAEGQLRLAYYTRGTNRRLPATARERTSLRSIDGAGRPRTKAHSSLQPRAPSKCCLLRLAMLADSRPPQGAFMAIEVDRLEERYHDAMVKGLLIQLELKD